MVSIILKEIPNRNVTKIMFCFLFCFFQLYRPSFVHPGAATVPTMSAAFPGASLYLPMAQSVAVGPLGSTIPMAYYPVGPIYPPGSAVLVEGGYDAGARFGAGATAGNIPVSMPNWELSPCILEQSEMTSYSFSNHSGQGWHSCCPLRAEMWPGQSGHWTQPLVLELIRLICFLVLLN
jgi:hypothetical protein